jgi:hypothetical protein
MGRINMNNKAKIIRVITPTKDCPLKLKDVVVYSVLKHAKSKNQIAKITGYHSSITLPPILIKLQKATLIKMEGKKYVALKPSGEADDWFVDTPSGDHKAYNKAVLVPGRSIIDCLVAWADRKVKLPVALLAKRFKCTRQTIRAARKRLNEQQEPAKTKEVEKPVYATKKILEPTTTIKKVEGDDMLTFEIDACAVSSPLNYAQTKYNINEEICIAYLEKFVQLIAKLPRADQVQILDEFVRQYKPYNDYGDTELKKALKAFISKPKNHDLFEIEQFRKVLIEGGK